MIVEEDEGVGIGSGTQWPDGLCCVGDEGVVANVEDGGEKRVVEGDDEEKLEEGKSKSGGEKGRWRKEGVVDGGRQMMTILKGRV